MFNKNTKSIRKTHLFVTTSFSPCSTHAPIPIFPFPLHSNLISNFKLIFLYLHSPSQRVSESESALFPIHTPPP
ncbi:hypothetical protein Hdeb2414_s0601g00922601 [Helianthus debilis subsp. tardiflorus]